MGKDEPEQTVYAVEDVGWIHHMWDEHGGELVTGLCLIVALALAAFTGAWAKHKFFPKEKL